MLFDHGNGGPAVIREPLNVDAVGQAHRYERVAHRVGFSLADLLYTQRGIPTLSPPGVEIDRSGLLIQEHMVIVGDAQRLARFLTAVRDSASFE